MQLINERLPAIKTIIQVLFTIIQRIIQVLTLTPETWSMKIVANFFDVTKYAACQARSLVQKNRILAVTDKKDEKKFISRYFVRN